MKSVSEKKSRGHRTSKIVKSKQSCSNGHLPYHLFILVLSARARCMTWHVISVRSKDAQKQIGSLRWLNRVMHDHEARARDLNRKLIFSFFLLFS